MVNEVLEEDVKTNLVPLARGCAEPPPVSDVITNYFIKLRTASLNSGRVLQHCEMAYVGKNQQLCIWDGCRKIVRMFRFDFLIVLTIGNFRGNFDYSSCTRVKRGSDSPSC